jgi:hypothetical protein
MNACRYMLTLTFGSEGEHDRLTAAKLVRTWIRDAHTGSSWLRGCYVIVPELHPGGHGWHMHILTPNRIPIERVRSSWTRFLAARGYSSPTGRIRCHAKDWGSSRHAAAYASKYVTKASNGRSATQNEQNIDCLEAHTVVPGGTHRYFKGDRTSEAVAVRESLPVWSVEHLGRVLTLYGVPEDARRFVEHRPDDGFPMVYCAWEDEVA